MPPAVAHGHEVAIAQASSWREPRRTADRGAMAGRPLSVLRSGARSAIARLVGYTIAALCVSLFLYLLVLATAVSVEAEGAGLVAWILGAALSSLAFVVATTIYVVRRPYRGGYALVALASLASSVLCLISFVPLLIF